MASLGRLAAAQVDERRVGRQPAAQDAQIAELTHELIVDCLEYLGDQRAVFGGQDLLFGSIGVATARAEAVDVGRAQAAGGDQVQQLAEAKVLAGTDAEHRHELALADPVVRGPAQFIGLDCLPLQVTHHQVFVELDDLLDDHAIRLGGRQRAASGVLIMRLDHVDHARKGRALPHWHVERHAEGAERFADRRQVGPIIDVIGIHLGDHDEPAQSEPARLLKQSASVDLDAGRPRHGHDHVFNGGQGAQGIADKVGIAGRVDQVDLLAGPGEMAQVAVDREVPAFLFLVDVEVAGAVVDRALAVGRAGGEKQGVGKTRLTRRPMTSEGDVPDIGYVVSRGHGVDSPCIGTDWNLTGLNRSAPFSERAGSRDMRTERLSRILAAMAEPIAALRPMASASENRPSYKARPTMQPAMGSVASRSRSFSSPTPPEAITGVRTAAAMAAIACKLGPSSVPSRAISV